MDAYQAATTRLDVREFTSKRVPADVKLKILEAARLTQSGSNTQHWRFILVQNKKKLKTLSEDSFWGKWVEKANFAVIVLTDPKLNYHMIDAGRVVQTMQIAAWSFGVGSCVFTGVNGEAFLDDFGVPDDLNPTIVVGFGYPTKKLSGKKNRKPLSEVAFLERYGSGLTSDNVG